MNAPPQRQPTGSSCRSHTYVIIHQLAHLMEGNHTPRFWNIVGANCPLGSKAKVWLKEHGQILEEEL